MKPLHLLAGLITPDVLEKAENADAGVLAELRLCDVLEIRYDLFPVRTDWPGLVQRVRALHPAAQRLATIRLERDGGKWPDQQAEQRLPLWRELLKHPGDLHLADLEMDCREDVATLRTLSTNAQVPLLLSRHYFDRVPGLEELQTAAEECIHFGVNGFKIACMSTREGDCAPLYSFLQQYAARFSYLSVFAMGTTGQASRLYSLRCGANLTYGAIGAPQAPGQIQLSTMRQALSRLSEWKSEADVAKLLGVSFCG